jgi:hypothetical protein
MLAGEDKSVSCKKGGFDMSVKLFRCLALALAIGTAPMAIAAGFEGLEYKRERTVKLKSGKDLHVMMGMMNGKMMAVIPMEDMNDLFERAEGHSMTID